MARLRIETPKKLARQSGSVTKVNGRKGKSVLKRRERESSHLNHIYTDAEIEQGTKFKALTIFRTILMYRTWLRKEGKPNVVGWVMYCLVVS